MTGGAVIVIVIVFFGERADTFVGVCSENRSSSNVLSITNYVQNLLPVFFKLFEVLHKLTPGIIFSLRHFEIVEFLPKLTPGFLL